MLLASTGKRLEYGPAGWMYSRAALFNIEEGSVRSEEEEEEKEEGNRSLMEKEDRERER